MNKKEFHTIMRYKHKDSNLNKNPVAMFCLAYIEKLHLELGELRNVKTKLEKLIYIKHQIYGELDDLWRKEDWKFWDELSEEYKEKLKEARAVEKQIKELEKEMSNE